LKTILVTGANGQLGNELKNFGTAYPQFKFIFCDRNALDISQADAVQTFFNQHKIDAVINAAAYTAVDKAETDYNAALIGNATAVENLANACINNNCVLIHVSTDYVFNGNNNEPYQPYEGTDPIGAYGKTKCLGEEIMQQFFIAKKLKGLIVRTSWVYSSYGNNFVKTMLRLMNERPALKVVADQKGRPTYAHDLADALLKITYKILSTKGEYFIQNKLPIYHYANVGEITWFEFAAEIAEQINFTGMVHPITTADFPTAAQRPAYSVLDTNSIESDFEITIPDWQDSLQVCLRKLRHK
jgi:dTDP-4-dehydrorhamnose reductase